MEYIHYGHKKFDIDKFVKITNREEFTKPNGGLWASRVDAEYGWKDWCLSNEYGTEDLKESFTFSLKEDAKILTITNCDQLDKLPRNEKCTIMCRSWACLDFERLSKEYDAIEVLISEDGQLYYKIYGWDCDSILIMNPEIIVNK